MDPSIHPSQSSTLIKHPTKPTKLLNGCGHPNDRLNHQRVHATGYTLLLELNFQGFSKRPPTSIVCLPIPLRGKHTTAPSRGPHLPFTFHGNHRPPGTHDRRGPSPSPVASVPWKTTASPATARQPRSRLPRGAAQPGWSGWHRSIRRHRSVGTQASFAIAFAFELAMVNEGMVLWVSLLMHPTQLNKLGV